MERFETPIFLIGNRSKFRHFGGIICDSSVTFLSSHDIDISRVIEFQVSTY